MKEKSFLVPEWLLKNIENTLKIAYNRDVTYGTCFERDIRGCLNCIRKILNNIEFTGNEKLEQI